jgi:hypothetical protein
MDLLWKTIEDSDKALFRFECLQDYSAEDGCDKVEYFIRTGSLLEHSENSAWWNQIKRMNDSGMSTARVRFVTEPISDYTKMELAYLKEAKKYSGEDIRIITEESFQKLNLSEIKDFYLVDNSQVFLMEYGDKGKYLGSELANDLDKYIILKDRLLENSLPL